MQPQGALVLAAVGLLLVKHFLFDFVFQTKFQLAHKHIYGHPGGLVHAGLHLVGTLAAILVFTRSAGLIAAILAAEFAFHYHVDWTKEQVLRRTGWRDPDGRYWAVFGADQLIHGLGYLAIAWALLTWA